MGFFKNLKNRLFTLNYDAVPEEIESKKKVEKIIDSSDDIIVEDLVIEETKKDKKELKRQLSEQKKERKALEKRAKVDKYVVGLKKSSSSFGEKLRNLQNKYHEVDENYLEELEEVLLMADVGATMTAGIIDEVRMAAKREKITDTSLVNEIVVDKLFSIYVGGDYVDTSLNIKKGRLNIILITGVNGVGKTTSIAKLVNIFQNQGFKTLIAAADTFRAGAVEQLAIWANRLKTDIVGPKIQNQDPTSIVFEALEKSEKDNYDILIIDTAGRLHNKVNLMNELAKIKRVIQKKNVDAPHEIILVIDATTGQNGIRQAVEFKEIIDVTGIILTKMDGTSKGGIILSIKEKLNLPVKYIGLGEKVDDLQEFDLDAFIYGLTKDLINAD